MLFKLLLKVFLMKIPRNLLGFSLYCEQSQQYIVLNGTNGKTHSFGSSSNIHDAYVSQSAMALEVLKNRVFNGHKIVPIYSY